MLKRISDEEISRVIQQGVTKWAIAPKEFIEQIGEVSAQAQLQADKKVVRKLFERIKRNFGEDVGDGRSRRVRIRFNY